MSGEALAGPALRESSAVFTEGMRRAEEVVSPQDPRQWRRLARALHQLVRDHFETFRAQAARLRDGQGLPRFVETVPDARASVIGHACEDKETAAKSCRNSRSPGPVIH